MQQFGSKHKELKQKTVKMQHLFDVAEKLAQGRAVSVIKTI
jgi:hypothetical protein